MKKILIPVACAAFISTGAMAKPMTHHAPQPHNNHHSVQMVSRAHHPAPHVHHHHAPTPVVVHHSHHDEGAVLLGSAIVAFAILASNAM